MPGIDIDFEVYKALTMLRPTEDVSYNDVIRKLLNLPSLPNQHTQNKQSQSADWTVKGVTFPEGTLFRAIYKGKAYEGRVEDGGLMVNGVKHETPSSAARAVTHNNVNGWRFWQAKLPEDTNWTLIEDIWRRTQK